MTYQDLKFKKDRIAFIRSKLATSPQWAVRGLMRIYENQTTDEQQAETVKYSNGIGFTGADGEFLSSLAKQYLAHKSLSPKQMTYVHKKMPKYAKQLETITGATP